MIIFNIFCFLWLTIKVTSQNLKFFTLKIKQNKTLNINKTSLKYQLKITKNMLRNFTLKIRLKRYPYDIKFFSMCHKGLIVIIVILNLIALYRYRV